jgi:hypothetical protein
MYFYFKHSQIDLNSSYFKGNIFGYISLKKKYKVHLQVKTNVPLLYVNNVFFLDKEQTFIQAVKHIHTQPLSKALKMSKFYILNIVKI